MADAVELPQKRFEVLFIDEIAQSHDYGETHVVFGLRVKIGLYELPHRLPLGGAEPPAEAVADGPVVDLGYKAGHVCGLFGGFAPGIADHQPLQHPLFEIEILGFGQILSLIHIFYVRSWIAVKPQNAVERALKFIPAAFIVFFLLSTLRGYVQPQWVIVAVFGLLYTLFTYARRHPRTRRYLMRMGRCV